jgi:hypothetical protein
MRDIILGREVGSTNTVRARRVEKRIVEACERRILEFPLGMDAREVAKELKREGCIPYRWLTPHRTSWVASSRKVLRQSVEIVYRFRESCGTIPRVRQISYCRPLKHLQLNSEQWHSHCGAWKVYDESSPPSNTCIRLLLLQRQPYHASS